MYCRLRALKQRESREGVPRKTLLNKALHMEMLEAASCGFPGQADVDLKNWPSRS
jgi:hypothetical protein